MRTYQDIFRISTLVGLYAEELLHLLLVLVINSLECRPALQEVNNGGNELQRCKDETNELYSTLVSFPEVKDAIDA
jgi:hypothetical protein